MELNSVLNFKFGLSSCLNCGSFLCSDSGFCQNCEREIGKRSLHGNEMLIHKNGIPVYRLYDWPVGASDAFSKLLLALKGPWGHRSWSHYAQEVFMHLPVSDFPKEFVVCPCPNFRGRHDHAYWFALHLAELLNCRFEDNLFEMRQSRKQRNLSKRARSSRRIGICEKFSRNELGNNLLFVDDVVTTGATMTSAKRALHQRFGDSIMFMGICMAMRI